MQTWIGTETPIAAMQMDIITSAYAPNISSGITSKQISSAMIPGGYRCILFGLNQSVISGPMIVVDGDVTDISNVVASDPDGIEVSVIIRRISSPKNVRVSM